jgi:hypothetical protein
MAIVSSEITREGRHTKQLQTNKFAHDEVVGQHGRVSRKESGRRVVV